MAPIASALTKKPAPPTSNGPTSPRSKPPQLTPDDKATSDALSDPALAASVKILRDPFRNEDTAFGPETRAQYGLRGLLPPAHQTLELQMERVMAQIRNKKTDLGRYVYLTNLRQTNVRLFYAVALKHTEEILPFIYTPTVGEACQKFSHIYRRPEGLCLTIEDKGQVASILDNWPGPAGSPRIAVITSGQRILGLGDQGFDGLGISIGKLALYVAGAGIHPRATLPIIVDVGTNNKDKLKDPLYLGLRRERVSDEEDVAFMDEVMQALQTKFPNLIVQFEDFSTEKAFLFLERYKEKYRTFNDDVQGTGAVILGGFTNAARLSAKASGRPLHDQRILFFGAGSAGVGVAKQLCAFFTRQGLTQQEAREKIWLVDSKGLVTNDRGDKLPEHKTYFSRSDNEGKQCKTLMECIEYVKPTALIGLSTVPNTFDETVLKKMAELNARPIVFPLSNPSSLSECDFETAVRATKGSVIFAAGSPFPECDFEGKHYIPGQGNNLYVFPGIGFGATLCKAGRITDAMITDAALALADSLSEQEKAEGRVYPKLDRIREISRDVAVRVIKSANLTKDARDGGYTASMSDEELSDWVEGEAWMPEYKNLTA